MTDGPNPTHRKVQLALPSGPKPAANPLKSPKLPATPLKKGTKLLPVKPL
jgi:hypothetical protein